MKKHIRTYTVAWAILLAIYTIVVFAVRPVANFTITYDARFWIAWVSVIAAFLAQLGCTVAAFKADSLEKLFLNIPLITQSYFALVVTVVVGSICMLIPDFPAWITLIVCVVIVGFCAIGVIKVKAAADIVSDVGQKVKRRTLYIRSMTAEAEGLVSLADTPEAKSALQKVYEAFRYSDPMSNDALASIESQITLKFAALTDAVNERNLSAIQTVAAEIVVLAEDRNRRCKLLK